MKSVIFFDIDDVLVKGQTQKLFLNFLLEKRKISLWRAFVISLWFLSYTKGFSKNVIEIRKFAFKVFEGWDVVTMQSLIEKFYKEVLSFKLNSVIVHILEKHRSEKHTIVFLSATLREIAERLAKVLHADFVVATELEIVDGKYTGQMKGLIPYGITKAEIIKEFVLKNNLSLEGSWAYADHLSDLPVLRLVQKAVVVNPESKLREIAVNSNWEVIVND